MDIEDNYSQQKLYERLEKNRERFRSKDLTKRRKKRHSMTASTRKRNLKHLQLMSRRSQPEPIKKQRKTKQTKMEEVAPESRRSSRAKKEVERFDPIKEKERQKQLQINVKEEEAKNAASKLVQSFGYSGKNVPVKILDTDLFNKALTQAIQDDLFGEANYEEAYSSDENMGMGKGRKSKRRRRQHRRSKKNK